MKFSFAVQFNTRANEYHIDIFRIQLYVNSLHGKVSSPGAIGK